MPRTAPAKCPPVPPELVEYLARRYEHPITKITPGHSDRAVGILVGHAQVIDYLRRQLEAQSKNSILE